MRNFIAIALTTLTLVLSPIASGDAFQGRQLVRGSSTTATAAGTTTLTVASNYFQQFTGATTQTVVLPNATTMKVGMAFLVSNDSSGTVTVNYNGGSLASTLLAGQWAEFVLKSAGTSAGTWDVNGSPGLSIARATIAAGTASHVVINDGSGNLSSEASLSVSRGGTGAATLTANNVLLGNGTSAVQFVAPSTSGNVLTSNGTSWTSSAPGSTFSVSAKTSDYTLLGSDYYVSVSASGGNVTITTPAAASNTGKVYIIKRTDTTVANQVIIDGNSSETVDGNANYVLAVKNAWIAIISDGTNWQITQKHNPWRLDATIAGANVSLGTSNVASYTGITNSGLTLTNTSGNNILTAQVPCSSTNSPSGTTCSSGDESIGVAFTLPNPGDVMACVSFGWSAQLDASTEYVYATFQVVETPTNAQTISQEGGSRIPAWLYANATASLFGAFPYRLCGTLSFASSGQKAVRLFYEQLVAGSPVASDIRADGGSTVGQNDIHWELYPLN